MYWPFYDIIIIIIIILFISERYDKPQSGHKVHYSDNMHAFHSN